MDTTPEPVSSDVEVPASQAVERVAETGVEVATVIADQASTVVTEVSSVVERLVDDTKAQLRERADTQLGQLAEHLDLLRRQLQALAEGRVDEAGSFVEYAQEGSDWLGGVVEHLDSGGLDGVTGDIKRFARSRPIVFLAGSAFAGLAIGRLLRNEAASVNGQRLQAGPSPGPEPMSIDLTSADAPSAIEARIP